MKPARIIVLVIAGGISAVLAGRQDPPPPARVAQPVRVLAIDQAAEEKNGQRVVVGKTATLELSPRQSETPALARPQGTLSLALRSLADFNSMDKPDTDDGGHGGSVNMVWFGVTTTTTMTTT